MQSDDERRLDRILDKLDTPEPNVASESGVNRSSTEGKINYLLVRDGPMYERWAAHLTAHIEDKGKRNWMNASTFEDLERFVEGACRHFEQWLGGDLSEDHAAALVFNVNGAEYTAARLRDQDENRS